MAVEFTRSCVQPGHVPQAGAAPGPESSILKLKGTEIQQRIQKLTVEAGGPVLRRPGAASGSGPSSSPEPACLGYLATVAPTPFTAAPAKCRRDVDRQERAGPEALRQPFRSNPRFRRTPMDFELQRRAADWCQDSVAALCATTTTRWKTRDQARQEPAKRGSAPSTGRPWRNLAGWAFRLQQRRRRLRRHPGGHHDHHGTVRQRAGAGTLSSPASCWAGGHC